MHQTTSCGVPTPCFSPRLICSKPEKLKSEFATRLGVNPRNTRNVSPDWQPKTAESAQILSKSVVGSKLELGRITHPNNFNSEALTCTNFTAVSSKNFSFEFNLFRSFRLLNVQYNMVVKTWAGEQNSRFSSFCSDFVYYTPIKKYDRLLWRFFKVLLFQFVISHRPAFNIHRFW